MSLRDKLEIGLKPDAPYRQDNLPEIQKDDPDCAEAAIPGTDPALEDARRRCDVVNVERPAEPEPTLSPADEGRAGGRLAKRTASGLKRSDRP